MQTKTYDEWDEVLANLVLDHPARRTAWYAQIVGLSVSETRFRLSRLMRDGHIAGRRYKDDRDRYFNYWAERGYNFFRTTVNETDIITEWLR